MVFNVEFLKKLENIQDYLISHELKEQIKQHPDLAEELIFVADMLASSYIRTIRHDLGQGANLEDAQNHIEYANSKIKIIRDEIKRRKDRTEWYDSDDDEPPVR